jgi:hypothetical protein
MGDHGEVLITRQLACGRVRNSRIAKRSDEDSAVGMQSCHIARRASDHPVRRGHAAGCTTQRHDSHNIDPRELRYPWHPWHGRPVWTRRTSARNGVAVFQCSLDPDSDKRLLEIPQWMFDASVVCLVRLSPFPPASSEALRALKELIDPRKAAVNSEVIQGRHPSPSRAGGSDAKPSEAASSKPTEAVPAAGHDTSLGEPCSPQKFSHAQLGARKYS